MMTTLSTAKDTIRDGVMSFAGISYAGNIMEFTLPDFMLKTEEYRAGGMDAPIALDMGMDALKISAVLNSFSDDVLSLFGTRVTFVARMGLQSEVFSAVYRNYVFSGYGLVTGVKRGTIKSGDLAQITVEMTLDVAKDTIDGEINTFIDIKNGIRTIGGVDQLLGKKLALGI